MIGELEEVVGKLGRYNPLVELGKGVLLTTLGISIGLGGYKSIKIVEDRINRNKLGKEIGHYIQQPINKEEITFEDGIKCLVRKEIDSGGREKYVDHDLFSRKVIINDRSYNVFMKYSFSPIPLVYFYV